MTIKLKVPPQDEPITLDEAKDFLKIAREREEEDILIKGLIQTARQEVEDYTQRSLLYQTWVLTLTLCPSHSYAWLNSQKYVSLPKPPFAKLLKVSCQGQEVDRLRCKVIDVRGIAQIELDPPFSYPIDIEYMAGYGPRPSDVPQPIRQSILCKVVDLYEHRSGQLQRMPGKILDMLSPYRILRLV